MGVGLGVDHFVGDAVFALDSGHGWCWMAELSAPVLIQ
jgi:hypothetical protein